MLFAAVKEFANPRKIDKVIAMVTVAPFLTHGVYQCMGYILSSDIYCVARAISISGLGGHIATFGCSSLSETFGSTFCELATIKNPRVVVGILALSILVPEI